MCRKKAGLPEEVVQIVIVVFFVLGVLRRDEQDDMMSENKFCAGEEIRDKKNRLRD